jgi:peptidyl-prolyl cis-trans isomerase SurA
MGQNNTDVPHRPKVTNQDIRHQGLMRKLAFNLAIFSTMIGNSWALQLDRIVAVVEEDVVLESELDEQITRVRARLRQSGTQVPPTAVLERQIMERLVLEKIQVQLAERAGVDVTEEALSRAISDIATRNELTLDQFQEILADEGIKFSQFREQIKQEIIIAKLRREEIDNRVRVRDTEIEAYLRNESNTNEDEQEYRLAHILVAIPSGGEETAIREARAKAEDTLTRLGNGESFSAVAISVSDGQNALDGGDLGWRKGSEIPSLFADSVSTMAVGETSSIITNQSGFHIVKLVDTRSGEKVEIEQHHARHILIKQSELVTEQDAMERCKTLRLRLESGADFGMLARTNSDDRSSALRGGDLGWVAQGKMVPEFEEVMLNIDVGELSQVFQSEFGFHVLQVTERRKVDGTDDVKRDRARRAIKRQKVDERRQSWLRRLRDEAYVEFRDFD